MFGAQGTDLTAVNTLIRGTRRLTRALGALTALVALLAALPYALIRFVGDPLPRTLPTPSGIQDALTSPPQAALYIDVLACLLWLCWLILALSFLVELAYAVRRVHAPRIPGLGPGQFVAAALIAAIGLGAGSAHPAAADTSSPLPASTPAATAQATPGTPAAPSTQVAGPATDTASDTVETVTVKSGDTLYGIAQTTLGNGKDWPKLYQENADRPQPDGARLTDPNLILPGWKILVDLPAPAATTSTTGAAHSAPATPNKPATATTPAPTPTHSTGTASNTAPGRDQHAAKSADRAARTSRSATGGAVRIDLAEGGAIAGSLLLALLAALALTRLQRRRFSAPFWPVHAVAPVLDELPPALRPAPPAATTVDDDELDEFGAPTDSEPSTGLGDAEPEYRVSVPVRAAGLNRSDHDAVRVGDADDDAPVRENPDPAIGAHIAVAHTDTAEITLDQLPGGVGLTGPGALGAARAIAAAILTDGAADNRLERARLLIGRDDLALLLESDPAHLDEITDGVAELDLAEDLPAALALMEEHLAYRTRLLEDYDCKGLEDLAEQHGDLEPQPALILLGLARQAEQGRLTATAAAGTGLRAHLVLLGSHPDQPTWHVAADAEITGAPDPRIPGTARAFDLSTDALHQALTMLARARGYRLRTAAPPQPPDPTGPLAAPLGLGTFADPEPGTPAPTATQDPDTTGTPAATSQTPAQQPGTAQPTVDDRHQAPADGQLAEQRTGADEQASSHARSSPAAVSALEPAAIEVLPAAREAGAAPQDAVAALLAEFHSTIVRVRVLGPLLIEDADGPISTGLRANSRRLAARLAVHHQRGQSSDELAELWPDHSGKDLAETRKTAMAYLRGPLRKATGATSAQFVLDTSGRYRLDPNLVGVDLALFDQLRTLSARSRDRLERAAAAEAALELCHGELLAGYDEPWIDPLRAGVRRDALATAALLAQLAHEAGNLDAALTWWEAARSIDDNEEVYRQIMKTQAALGRRVEVIATRDLLIAKLEAIGEYPSARTEQLLSELLRERPRPAAPVATAIR